MFVNLWISRVGSSSWSSCFSLVIRSERHCPCWFFAFQLPNGAKWFCMNMTKLQRLLCTEKRSGAIVNTLQSVVFKEVSSSFKRIWQTVWLAFETFTLQPYYYYTVYCSINRLWVSNAPVNFRLTSVAYWMTLKWCKLSRLLTTVQWTWSISGAL